MSARALALAACASLLPACAREAPSGPVRSAMEASEVAQQALRSAGRDELVVDARRHGDDWVVTTRWRETSMAGHLVTVDAATGEATVERYRSIELGGPR